MLTIDSTNSRNQFLFVCLFFFISAIDHIYNFITSGPVYFQYRCFALAVSFITEDFSCRANQTEKCTLTKQRQILYKLQRCRKRGKAIRFLIESQFIHLILQFYYNASVNFHSQLLANWKITQEKSRCKHMEQGHIWAKKHVPHTRFFGYIIDKRDNQKWESN